MPQKSAVRFLLVALIRLPPSAPLPTHDHEAAVNEAHLQHPHLAPRSYGAGLRRRRYSGGGGGGIPAAPRLRRRPPGRKKKPAKRKKKPGKGKPGRNKKPGKKENPGKKKKPAKKPRPGGGGAKGGPDKDGPAGNSRPTPTKPEGGGGGAKGSLARLSQVSDAIDDHLFLYETPTHEWVPSDIYRYDGLARGLEVMSSQGVAGMRFFLGDDGEGGVEYGLTNVAAFLAQSMKETIRYNACSENNWDLYKEGYPLSNACGQLGQSYQDYHCPRGQEHMECPVDSDMKITAATNAKWYGAPAPFFCMPKRNKDDFTGKWNFGKFCNLGWVDPPMTCDVYEGQKAGGFDNDRPVANRAGRTDVEGCCWWGRGVIQTTGVCNFGKLNYYLGKRAADEGRKTPYGEIDFCKDPEAICTSKKFQELKWIAGMFYWMESVQGYDVGGWNYFDELRKFVDGRFQDRAFIDAVSGIVNRGCHNPPCGTGAVDGGNNRHTNFMNALATFKLTDAPEKGVGNPGSPVLACGADYHKASKACDTKCKSNLDCPEGQYCYADVACSKER